MRAELWEFHRGSAQIPQKNFELFHAPADTVPDGVLRHIFRPGNSRLAPAQDIVGVDAPGLDGREAVKGGIEGGVALGLLHDLLRGQRGIGHVGLKTGSAVQGALVMVPLAPLVDSRPSNGFFICRFRWRLNGV